MALESQLIDLPFQSGIDQKIDKRWLDVGSQTGLVNGVFRKAGAIGKRWGYTIVNQGDSVFTKTNGSGKDCALGVLGDQLWQTGRKDIDTTSGGGAQRLFAFINTTNEWAPIDHVPDCNAYHSGIVEWNTSTNTYDTAYGNGYVCAVYTALPVTSSTLYQVYASVMKWSNGVYVKSNVVLSTPGTQTSVARVITVPTVNNTYFISVWYDQTATTDLYAAAFDTNNLAWSAATKIISNFDPAADKRSFDIAPVTGLNDAWVIVFPRQDGATRSSKVIQFTTAFATTASTTFGPPAGHVNGGHGYAICADTHNVWSCVAYDDGANTHPHVRGMAPTTLAQTLAETDLQVNYTGTTNGIRIGGCVTSATQSLWITSNRAASIGTRWRTITTTLARGTTRTMFNYDVASKPYLYTPPNGTVSLVFANLAFNGKIVGFTGIGPAQVVQSIPQGTYELVHLVQDGLLYDGSTSSAIAIGRPIATLAPRIANTAMTVWDSTICTNFTAIDSTTLLTSGSVSGGTSTRFGLRNLVYEFGGDRFGSVELGGVCYISGGVPSCYDGQAVTEIGFLHPPPGALSLVPSNSAGAMANNGVYNYYVLYQYVNAKGDIVRGAASSGTVTLGAADNTVTITMNSCTCTTKQDAENGFGPPIGFAIYRTNNGGSTYYQLVSDSAITASDPGTYSFTYVDKLLDASTLNGFPAPVWPSSGGALEGVCPPALSKLVVYNLRLFGIGDDRQSLWYSTEHVPGEQPRFNDNFIVNCGEDITGLEVMDGALYIFTATGILRLQGHGPTEEGTNNDFSSPDIVPSDAGCTNSRAIVATNQGIFFQSSRGIYLLTRGGEPIYVGQAVEDTLESYPIISKATLVAHHNEVRFECKASEAAASTGVTLVYNYNFKTWSIFERYDTDQALALCAAVSSVVVDDTYYWTTYYGQVYQENSVASAAGAFKDGTAWVTLSIESAWLHAHGIQGWGMFRYVNVLGEQKEAHDLTISVAQDYDETYAESVTFEAADMATWETPLEAASYQIGNQRCASLRVKLNDGPPSGLPSSTGEGPLFIGLQIDYGVYPSRARIPTSQGA